MTVPVYVQALNQVRKWGGGGGGGGSDNNNCGPNRWAANEVGCPIRKVDGGVAVSVRLKPYNQTSAWDGAPTVLRCIV